MELKKSFEDAKTSVEQLTQKPDNDELLKLYGLFKQATIGNNNGSEPGGFDFKAAAKYNAWKNYYGMSPDEAMSQYIDLANSVIQKYS